MVINPAEIWNTFMISNTQANLVQAGLVFVVLFAVFKFFDSYFVYVLKRAGKKTKTKADDVIIDFIEGITWPFFFYLSIYFAAKFLVLPDQINSLLNYGLYIFIIFYAAKGIVNISDMAFDRYKQSRKKKGEPENSSMIGVLKVIAKLAIWSIALLMLLSNFGIEVTPLIAGLGVGGIAVGLALQSVLGDLFSAFAIYFDKPFEEGDFIIVGNDMGTIKHIGIKSTRIEALGGQELVMSNSELTGSRINNYKKMNHRRIVFGFGLEYDTTPTKLRKAKKIVEEVIKKEKNAKLDRVHFKGFGDSSLDFEVVYYVNSSDYNVYMDVQEKINLHLKEKIEKAGMAFAFPSRTIYMAK